MHRRDVLSAAAGLGGSLLASGGSGVAGHPTPSGAASTGDVGGTTATAGDAFAPLGFLALPGSREAVVGDDGSTAYLAVDDGFAVVDVADPSSPRLIAERRGLLPDATGGPLEAIQEVAVDGDRLLVVGPAHPDEKAVKAALLYDVGDPGTPRLLAVHHTDYPIHNADLRDGLAYLTANRGEENALEIVDLTAAPGGESGGDGGAGEETPGGAAPVPGRWSLADVDEVWADVPPAIRPLHDVFVRGDVAYCSYWDAGTWLLDVSDPAAPRPVGQVGDRPPVDLAEIEAVGREARELPGNHHSAALDEAGALLAIGREAWDADDDGAGAPGGIDLVDVSDPRSPERLATVAPPPTSDPSFRGVWTTAHNFELRDDHLYSAWYQGGVRVHDVSEPRSPREVAAWRDSATTRFWAARRAGSALVASSMGTDAGEAGLYTFPLPDGDAAFSARGTTASSTAAEPTGDGSGHDPTATERAVTATPGLAGFGVTTAILGGGLAWLLARWNRD